MNIEEKFKTEIDNQKQKDEQITIREMQINDYKQVFHLWTQIKGFALRSVDDSYEGIDRFLKRNQKTSIVALIDGAVVGSILCGQDGRRGCFYHVCVDQVHRHKGIGHKMVQKALNALEEEKISKVSLVAFKENGIGNSFWKEEGWVLRTDLNSYDYTLNKDNIVNVNQ